MVWMWSTLFCGAYSMEIASDGWETPANMADRDLCPTLRVPHGWDDLVEGSLDVLAALALMTQRRIRHLPVVEGGRLQGIVSIGDLVKYRMERIEAEAEAMRAYIQSA